MCIRDSVWIVKELETKLKMYENMKDVSVSISNGPKQRPNLSETTSVYTKLLSLVLYHSIAYVLIYVLLQQQQTYYKQLNEYYEQKMNEMKDSFMDVQRQGRENREEKVKKEKKSSTGDLDKRSKR